MAVQRDLSQAVLPRVGYRWWWVGIGCCVLAGYGLSAATTRWPAASRHLAVKIDQCAVDGALEALLGSAPESSIAFDGALSPQAGAAQDIIARYVALFVRTNSAAAVTFVGLEWVG
jgi:hypothetical protein